MFVFSTLKRYHFVQNGVVKINFKIGKFASFKPTYRTLQFSKQLYTFNMLVNIPNIFVFYLI